MIDQPSTPTTTTMSSSQLPPHPSSSHPHQRQVHGGETHADDDLDRETGKMHADDEQQHQEDVLIQVSSSVAVPPSS